MHAGIQDGLSESVVYRVGHLETSVESLHRDSARTQASLAALASKVDSFGTFLSDISAKLDQQRTRRPDMAGLAAMISLVFVIGGLAFAPLYQWVGRLQEQQDKILQVQWERTGTVAEFAADRDHLQEQIENIRAELKVAELKLLGNGNG